MAVSLLLVTLGAPFDAEEMPADIQMENPLSKEGRSFCMKARWTRGKVDSFILLATWHGPRHDPKKCNSQFVRDFCKRLRELCDREAATCLGCVLAGDFNIELLDFRAADFSGFQRLDPDERIRVESAGRRRNGQSKADIDHILFFRPPASPLSARRPRRFRLYDYARLGILARDVHDTSGLLDHDPLLFELWLQ